jgi:hypothetical protein
MVAAPLLLLPLLLWVGVLAVGLAATVFWIWMLVEVATKEPSQGNDKIVWLLVVLFTHWIGALIYFLARRPERIRLFGQ